MKFIFLLSALVSINAFSQSAPRTAVVYGGEGACEEDCVTAVVEAAKIAGFTPVVVLPGTWDPAVLKDAAVWLQPGGYAVTSAKAMGKKMMADVRAFVKAGGGYVGFCAGAFIATSKIGTSTTTGYGFSPGITTVYKAKGYPTIEKMSMKLNDGLQHSRQIYWEGGPYFKFTKAELPKVDVRGTYSRTNQISAIQTTYGSGKVSLTGAHPESPQWWRDSSNLIDSDGLDYDITTEMIQWAAKAQ
jgi:Biotin-protein ligase, N terminal